MFEIGAKFDDAWKSDNKERPKKKEHPEVLPPERHRLWLNREKRRGKWVTLCGPFALEAAESKALLKALKKELGSGGAWKAKTLEIQGDRETDLKTSLEKRGFRFR